MPWTGVDLYLQPVGSPQMSLWSSVSYSLRVLRRQETPGRLLQAWRAAVQGVIVTRLSPPAVSGLPQARDGEHHFRHRRRTLGQILLCLAPRAKRVRRAGVRAWRPSTAIS